MSTSAITIEELLRTTSRTFALSIPLLCEPTRQEITLAYLVFRIADTLEDADFLDRQQRRRALREFSELLAAPDERLARLWTDRWTGGDDVSRNEHYNRLLRETPAVLDGVNGLDSNRRRLVVEHARRSAEGMEATLASANADGSLQLNSLEELRRYCYYVAGIVGELITALFVSHASELRGRPELEAHAASFGEGLQLVNILKDSSDDRHCGRAYIPAAVSRAEVFALARKDLQDAECFVAALRAAHAPPGYVAFCDAPLQLAHATLQVVERHGPGAKVPRPEVATILRRVIERAGLDPLSCLPALVSDHG